MNLKRESRNPTSPRKVRGEIFTAGRDRRGTPDRGQDGILLDLCPLPYSLPKVSQDGVLLDPS